MNIENIYDALEDNVVFGWFKKADGSYSYRGITRNEELYGKLFSGVVTASDKGKAKRKHWTDDLSSEEIKEKYVSGEKSIYVYDVVREGRKGISVYLTNISEDNELEGLPNNYQVKVEDVINDERFIALDEGKLDVEDYIKNTGEVKEEISEDTVKRVLKSLESDAYLVTFRKKSGEPRVMLATRNQEIVDELSGEGAYDSLFANDLLGEDYVNIMMSKVIPVYDLEKSDKRTINLKSLLSLEGRKPFIKVELDTLHMYLTGEIELKELVEGTFRQRQMARKGKTPDDLLVDRLKSMGDTVYSDRWKARLGRVNQLFSVELAKEFREERQDLSKTNLYFKRYGDNKVFDIRMGAGEGRVHLLVSPKGIYDMVTHEFHYKENAGSGEDKHRGGIKLQQHRIQKEKNLIGLTKALLVSYILDAFNGHKKFSEIRFFNEDIIGISGRQ